jgi:putative transcriptional regulator
VQDYSAAQIKRLRLRFKASQAVFAAYLNTSTSTNGPALKLLNLADRKGLDVLA